MGLAVTQNNLQALYQHSADPSPLKKLLIPMHDLLKQIQGLATICGFKQIILAYIASNFISTNKNISLLTKYRTLQ